MPTLPLPAPPLGDDVVVLRSWREPDIPAQLKAFGDPLFERYSDWAPRTVADAVRYLAEHEAARVRGEQLELALVEPGHPNVLLGGVSLNNVSLPQGRAAVGYWLAPEARGRGIATRAVRLLARWTFDSLGIARLELTCVRIITRPNASLLVVGSAARVFFAPTCPFKGGRRDTVVFGLLPGELR